MPSSSQRLSLLKHPDQLVPMLAAELSAARGEPITLHQCVIDYVRQSATRTSVQYTLDLEDARGARGQQVITAVGYGDDRTEQQWERIRDDIWDATAPVGQFQLPGASYSATLDVILQVFPFDFRLPGLRQLVLGNPTALARIGANLGAAQVTSWEAEVARYRPDMRAMARVRAGGLDALGQPVARTVYAKTYRDNDEGQRAFDLLTAFARWSADPGVFSVPEPLAYHPDLQTLVLAEAPGTRLLDIVRQHDPGEAAAAVRRAARAVAAMHRAPVRGPLLTEMAHDKDAQFSDVAANLMSSYPQMAAEIADVAGEITAVFEEPELSPTHYDLKQGHILIDDGATTILDFDKMALGDPLIDVANVVATLGAEREGSAKRAARRGNLAGVFVEEYFAAVPSEWAPLFPAHLARATLLEAGTTGRSQRGRKSTSRPEERLEFALGRAREALAS
ncbi:MAG: phosphotransferase [Thermomicrobiales bacterium]